jgi:hypothetical protein
VDECKPLVLGAWTIQAAANAPTGGGSGGSEPKPIAASASFSIDLYVLPTFEVRRCRLTLSNPR